MQKDVGEESMKVGVSMEDAICQPKLIASINQIAIRFR